MTKLIKERIGEIVEDLILFENDLEKYEYIVDLGKELKPMDDSLKVDSFLVEGCTSRVWLIPVLEDGKIVFSADSDSVIVKGLISILIKVFSYSFPDDILLTNLKDLEVLKLSEIISPTRQNGIYHMVKKIMFYAKMYGEKDDSKG